MPKIKIARYRVSTGAHEVAYAVIGNSCTFTGLMQPGTTINYAEQVRTEIIRLEGDVAKKYHFFDLQTNRGYPHHQLGEYEYDEVIFKLKDGKYWADAWHPTPCPKEVVGLFREYIGGKNVSQAVNCPEARLFHQN